MHKYPKIKEHVWNRVTSSPLYYNDYCKTSGQLLRQNPNNKCVLCDHLNSRCAGIVLLLPLWVHQRKLEAITCGDHEGVGGEDEGQLHHHLWTLLKRNLGGRNPDVDISGIPAKAWLTWEHLTAGSDIYALLIMTVSLIHNIDFPLLLVQTLEYLCFYWMSPSVPGAEWADSLRKLCGT